MLDDDRTLSPWACRAFNRALDAWARASMADADTLARCLGMTAERLADLRAEALPVPAEVDRLATAMEWPASRLAYLAERTRLAQDARAAAAEVGA